ncbi:hypothetical protein LINGRAHAP2_LOCUS10051, partial [Linum grandiflorum]
MIYGQHVPNSQQFDPSATLFVNYHIEDGSDVQSSPKMYTRQVLQLQEQGAETWKKAWMERFGLIPK